uniref:UBX domain-containing protein n=2 Tax=Meloidogyne incognita TaxID=6306 RepID=A0A914NG91_MELIC
MDNDKRSNSNTHKANDTNRNENGVDAGGTSSGQGRHQSSSHNPLNNTQYLVDTDDEDYADYTFRSDSPLELLDKKDFHNQNSDRIPLIPTDFTSIHEAIQNFTAVFQSRYGAQHPPFFDGPLQKAITEAFDNPNIEERRPLVLYLHHDDSVAAHIFPQNVLCSVEISNLLKCQFLVWAWDVTQEQNRKTLFDWMNLTNLGNLVEILKVSSMTGKYPLLIILCKDRSSFQQNTFIYGQEDVASAMQKLMIGLDQYQGIRHQNQEEERGRLERELFRQEQAQEYERSLALDKAKQQELHEQKTKEREAEEKNLRLQAKKQSRLNELAMILPPEPEESDPKAISIRFRCPNGEMKMRRFSRDESVEMLIIYAESIGFERTHFRLWNSDRPKKEVSSMNTSKTFEELHWPKRENITIEEM